MTSAVENVALVRADGPELPAPVIRRGISEAQWRTLFNLFPGAHPDSALMVWDYCIARKLDPLKKPCHIVPIRAKQGDQWVWKDVVMPGIYEYRITAQRTGLYLGHTEPEYGPETEFLGVKAPSWCAMTFHRWNEKTAQAVPFPVKVWFAEVAGTSTDRQTKKEFVNDRWSRAPIQMLTKCAEAAGLREAFPEEFGGEATAEEMDGHRPMVEDVPSAAVSLPKPAQRIPAAESPVVTAASEPQPVSAPAAEAATDAQSGAPSVTVVLDGREIAKAVTSVTHPHIGKIAGIHEKLNGSAFIELETGFVAGTASLPLIAAAREARSAGVIVELGTKPANDPTKFKPTLQTVTERVDLMDGQQ